MVFSSGNLPQISQYYCHPQTAIKLCTWPNNNIVPRQIPVTFYIWSNVPRIFNICIVKVSYKWYIQDEPKTAPPYFLLLWCNNKCDKTVVLLVF